VLSRIAESLYWIGRYVERADDTSRILDVYTQRFVEDPWVDERSSCVAFLEIMGMPVPDDVDSDFVLARVAYEAESTASIAGALHAARENARGAREAVSSEVWEALNTTWLAVPDHCRRARRVGPHSYLGWVRERAAVVNGHIDATMSRDEGWHFLALGRSLERLDMTSRLLMTCLVPGPTAPTVTTVLRACGAHEAFLRTRPGTLDATSVLTFLALDQQFPRSLLHAITNAETCLAELHRHLGATDLSAARRLLGRCRTTLEFGHVDRLVLDLLPQLMELQRTCSTVNDSLAERCFPQTLAMAWSVEGDRS
jgi:uncharacterized alpha-E superfamily protein